MEATGGHHRDLRVNRERPGGAASFHATLLTSGRAGTRNSGLGTRSQAMRTIPLSRVTVTPEMKQAILDVVDSGRFILGPEVRAFEKEFAQYIGVAHAVAVSQGTA